MKLVILGAGASYDSIYRFYKKENSEPWKPPLCNELFELRENFNPIITKYYGARGMRSEILTKLDIETYFQDQWNFAIENKDIQLYNNLINIQYYLSEVFCMISSNYSNAGLSNIDVLLNKARAYSISKKEKILFVTFNYDTLFEDSVEKVCNKKVSNLNDYINSDLILIKCHGSCNWFQRFQNLTNYDVRNLKSKPIYEFLYSKMYTLNEIESLLDGRIFIYNNINDFVFKENKSFKQHLPYYPQLLIPLKTKDGFVLPENHQQCLMENMKKVDDILIIGWKGNEVFFNKQLSESLSDRKVQITVINAKNRDIKNQFDSAHICATYTFYESMNVNQVYPVGSFSQYIQDVNQDRFPEFFK